VKWPVNDTGNGLVPGRPFHFLAFANDATKTKDKPELNL